MARLAGGGCGEGRDPALEAGARPEAWIGGGGRCCGGGCGRDGVVGEPEEVVLEDGEVELGGDAGGEKRRGGVRGGRGSEREAEPVGEALAGEDESDEGEAVRCSGGGEERAGGREEGEEKVGERRVGGGEVDEGGGGGGGDEEAVEQGGEGVGEEGARVVGGVAGEVVEDSGCGGGCGQGRGGVEDSGGEGGRVGPGRHGGGEV